MFDALISRNKNSFILALRESSQVLLEGAARKVDTEVEIIRDLKIQGREGQDKNGSGHGKLSRVPSFRQGQNA